MVRGGCAACVKLTAIQLNHRVHMINNNNGCCSSPKLNGCSLLTCILHYGIATSTNQEASSQSSSPSATRCQLNDHLHALNPLLMLIPLRVRQSLKKSTNISTNDNGEEDDDDDNNNNDHDHDDTVTLTA